MPSLTTLVLGLEGLIGALNGAANVLFPSITAGTAEAMGSIPLPAVHAINLTGLALGLCYINIAYKHDVPMMWFTVVARAIAAGVFYPSGGLWETVAYFEGGCGVLMLGALLIERLGRQNELKI